MALQPTEEEITGRDWFFFALVLAPFYLNDFLLIGAQDANTVLAIDYGSRVISLVILFSVSALRSPVFASLRMPPRIWESIGWVLVCTAVVAGVHAFAGGLISGLAPHLDLFDFPPIKDNFIRWLDLTLGLALVAISEELIFRSALGSLLRRMAFSPVAVMWISAVLFAAIHWSGGLGVIATALVAGLLFMWVYQRLGSVIPLITAHFLVDFLLFL